MPPKNVNTKVQAGLAKKAEVASQKSKLEQQKIDAQEAAEWNQGSNQRKAGKEQESALKADEADRKRREKAELVAAEEAGLANVVVSKGGKAAGGAAAKKKKAKSDLDLLEDALVSAADKKMKKKKELDKKKKEDEEKRIRELETKKQIELAKKDPLLANTEAMLGNMMIIDNKALSTSTTDDDHMDVGRNANIRTMQEHLEGGGSGIDAALGTLNNSGGTIGGSGGNVKGLSAKALYNEFEQKMLPILKAENPGLRLSQYKERIFTLWKKSPENPANQIVS